MDGDQDNENKNTHPIQTQAISQYNVPITGHDCWLKLKSRRKTTRKIKGKLHLTYLYDSHTYSN